MAAVLDAGYMSFEHWTKKYAKKYVSKTIEDERKKLWEQNLEFVKQHNAQFLAGKHSYRIQQTRCSDQTHEEIMKWMSCKLQPTAVSSRVGGGGGGGCGGCGDPGMTYDSQRVEDERKKLLEHFKPVKQPHKEFVIGKSSNPIQQNRCSDQTNEKMMSCKSQPITATLSGGDGGGDGGSGRGGGRGGDGGGGGDPGNGRSPDELNPDRVDWRERGCVTPVKDQRPLPACWIFAAVSAVESHNAITNGKLVELSVQQLVDCIGRGDERGYVEWAFDHIAVNGSIRESDYRKRNPFQRGDCMSAGMRVEVRLHPVRFYHVGNTEQALETAVAHKGPVVVTLTFFNRDQQKKFQSLNYEDVFYDPNPDGKKKEVHYAALVVGYGSQQNEDNNEIKFWLIKNSWGCDPNDRNSGFQKIAKDRGNQCNIALHPLYPLVETRIH